MVIRARTPVHTIPVTEAAAAPRTLAVASQLQLTWWRFRRHRLACFSGVVVVLFYLLAGFADFFATWIRTTPRRGAPMRRRRRSAS